MQADMGWANSHFSTMSEVLPVVGNTYMTTVGYKDAQTTSLIYRLPNRQVVFIDPGFLICPEMFSWLDKNELTVRAILCSHYHWDHIFPNEALYKRYGCEVFATRKEIETALVGWKPAEYPVTLIEENADIDIDGFVFRTMFTPGHSLGHQAIITPDDVCYLGDAIMSPEVLAKSKLPFMEDVEESVFSMEKIRASHYGTYVVSHLGVITADELSSVIDLNVEKETVLYSRILSLVKEPVKVEDLIVQFMRSLRIYASRILSDPDWRHTSRKRIMELVDSGELLLEGDTVYPNHK